MGRARALRSAPALVALLAAAVAGCGGSGSSGAPPAPAGPTEPEEIAFAPSLRVELSAMRKTSSGLYVQDVSEGTGLVARRTSTVAVRYTGYLADGRVFDTTGSGQPVTFQLGGREVIRGWNEGIPGMKVGGVRRLVVRPELAYGRKGRGGVPPDATLVFELQLVGVR